MFDPSRNELPDFFRQVIFPAKITVVTLAGDGTTWLYDWTEQRIDRDGSLVDADAPRKGLATGANAAREINNERVSALPRFVWMRLRGSSDSDPVYEFMAGSSSESIHAQITGKCHRDGSGCTEDAQCLDRNIAYWWVRVIDSVDPCALTYSEHPDGGGPGCYPLYHLRDLNLPCWPPASPRSGYATSAESNSDAGSVAWSNASNATASDDSSATAELTPGQSTHYLKASFPCFGIPAGVTITNVKVSIEAKGSASSSIVDVEIKLTIDGTVVGTSQHTGVALGATDAVRDYSHSPATWGATITPESTIGVAARYSNGAEASRTVSVDSIALEITFTPDGFIGQRKSIFRIWRGAGDYYLFDGMPSVEHILRSESEDADGVISYILERDQNTHENKAGREVRLVLPEVPV